MRCAELLISLAAVVTALTPVMLIWLTLRGTTPRQRADLLPALSAALHTLLRGTPRPASRAEPVEHHDQRIGR
jgi:hypothetical protein